MADLADLVEPLKRAVNPPGEDLYPNAQTAEWVGRLSDAFWEARMHGFFVGYFEDEGEVLPEGGAGEDPPRELLQVIVTYAAYKTTKTRLVNLTTATRSKAGPVSFEVERSAALMVQVFKDLTEELKYLRDELKASKKARYGSVAFFDGVLMRDSSLRLGLSSWTR